MAPSKSLVKPQIVTPCSSPSAMAAKAAKKPPQSPQKSPVKGITAETQTAGIEGEHTPSGKDILEAIKASSEVLTNKMDALAVDVCSIKRDFDKIQKKTAEIEIHVSKVEDKIKKDNKEWQRKANQRIAG